ncbi:MAG: hypothetical protein ACJ75H_17005 [Thermoanaerobaculia bacterium]
MKAFSSLHSLNTRRWVQRPDWLAAFGAGLAACLLALLVNALVSEVRPGSGWGRTYGALAVLLMIAAALLGVRRRTMRLSSRPIGRTQDWVQLHVYGGVLFLVLVLMHTGLRLPGTGFTAWLLALSVWVAVSGLLGVALRKWVPRLLTSSLSLEVLYERIPELIEGLRPRCEALAATSATPVQDVYRRRLAKDLAGPRPRWIYFLDPKAGIQDRLRELDFLRRLLGPEDQGRLDELQALYRAKLEMDAHYTLQRALRWWLYGHIPVSFVLILLVGIHVVTVLLY